MEAQLVAVFHQIVVGGSGLILVALVGMAIAVVALALRQAGK
jgi:hypothetical protein